MGFEVINNTATCRDGNGCLATDYASVSGNSDTQTQ